MPVSADVQAAISQRYAQLADSITHANAAEEKAILAPHFVDRAKMKLGSFEYDPLTVLVQKIVVTGGGRLTVHAEYVGVHGHNATTVDVWQKKDDDWILLSRQ